MAEMTPERIAEIRWYVENFIADGQSSYVVELLDAYTRAQQEIMDLRERVEYAIGYIESTEDTLRRGYSGALVADTLKLGLLPDLRAALAPRTPGETGGTT